MHAFIVKEKKGAPIVMCVCVCVCFRGVCVWNSLLKYWSYIFISIVGCMDVEYTI